jgi:hypothetical protein
MDADSMTTMPRRQGFSSMPLLKYGAHIDLILRPNKIKGKTSRLRRQEL